MPEVQVLRSYPTAKLVFLLCFYYNQLALVWQNPTQKTQRDYMRKTEKL